MRLCSADARAEPEREEEDHEQTAGQTRPTAPRDSPLSAPAVNPCTVAKTNIGKLERCTACQTLRGSLRIVQDVTWMATRRYVAAIPHATGPGRQLRRHRHEQLARAEVDEVVGPQREDVHRDEHQRQRPEKLVQIEDTTPGCPCGE